MLYNGERVGAGGMGPDLDIAVDPSTGRAP